MDWRTLGGREGWAEGGRGKARERVEEFRIGILIFVRDDSVLLRALHCKVCSYCMHPWVLLSCTAKSLISTESLVVLSLLGEVIPEAVYQICSARPSYYLRAAFRRPRTFSKLKLSRRSLAVVYK